MFGHDSDMTARVDGQKARGEDFRRSNAVYTCSTQRRGKSRIGLKAYPAIQRLLKQPLYSTIKNRNYEESFTTLSILGVRFNVHSAFQKP